MTECDYKWGYGFIKFKEEASVQEAVKALKGKEVALGKKIYFEIQGPNGEQKRVAASNDTEAENGEKSVHSRIGPVCLFLGNLKEGTTAEEISEVVQPYGETKKIDIKNNFGFVHFKEPNACREALTHLSNKVINGNNPRVQLAEIKKGSKVFVGNLHDDVNQEELITTFLECGPVVEYKFVRQFAFFTYDDLADAKAAVKELNGKKMFGVKLKVAISTADRAIFNGDADACHKCGHSGHWAKECPQASRGSAHGSGYRGRSRSPVRRDSHGYSDSHHRGSRRY